MKLSKIGSGLLSWRKPQKSKEVIRLQDGLPIVCYTNGVYAVSFLFDDKTIVVAEFADDDDRDCRQQAHWLYDTLRRAQNRK